jgi:hypothetical protein
MALSFALDSCNDTCSKNKSAVEEAVNLREAFRKKDLKSVEITGHLISGTGIIVYVSGKHRVINLPIPFLLKPLVTVT